MSLAASERDIEGFNALIQELIDREEDEWVEQDNIRQQNAEGGV